MFQSGQAFKPHGPANDHVLGRQFISVGFRGLVDTLNALMPKHSYGVKKQFVMLCMGHAPHVLPGYAGGRGPAMRHSTHLEKEGRTRNGPFRCSDSNRGIAACDFSAGKLR